MNEKLKRQLAGTQRSISEKDGEITSLHRSRLQLQNRVYDVSIKETWDDLYRNNLDQFQDFRQVEAVLVTKLKETELLVLNNIARLMPRFSKLLTELDILKRKTACKDECKNKLIKSLEILKLESAENVSYINRLKQENNALHAVNCNQEKNLNELRKNISEKDTCLIDLQNKNVSNIKFPRTSLMCSFSERIEK